MASDYSIEVVKTTAWVPKPSGRGGRSKVVYEARLGDLSVQGDTPAKAKDEWLRIAAAYVSGDWTPTLIQHRHWAALVFRSPPRDWGYKLLDPDREDGEQRLYGSGGYPTRKLALEAARYAIAQAVFTTLDPLKDIELIETPEKRTEFLSWASWQMRYATLEEYGYQGRLHETASGLERWPDNIPKPAELTAPEVPA